MRPRLMTAIAGLACAMLSSTALAEPSRPPMGPLGDRDVVVQNHSDHTIVELYVSPQSADAWGQDRLAEDVVDPAKSVRLKLGRMRDCGFDVLAVYDDASREETRGLNVCQTHQLAFDRSRAIAATEPPGPAREVTVINASPRPIQQLFFSPADAPQWGEDRVTQSAISTTEARHIEFRGDCVADVRVVFANRAAEERRGLDLCAYPTLRIEPGWTTSDRPDTHD